MASTVKIKVPEKFGYKKTLSAAAAHLGMSVRTLENWRQKGRIKPTPKGWWNTERIATYAMQINSERVADPESEEGGQEKLGNGDKDELDRQLKAIKVRREEIQLKLEEGSLVSRDEVEHQRVRQIMTLKRSFLSMGRELAPGLCYQEDPRVVQSIIDEAVKYRIRVFAMQEGEEE